jgi:2-dehydro-3-deoxygluconokinase
VADLVSIGECMVELSRRADGFSLAFGGDTFNTAVYASRLGLGAAYATALGDDPYSDAILALARSESVEVDAVPRLAGRLPGLYLIETDARGERRFFYWRSEAPARQLFELQDGKALETLLGSARFVYFSGITLSLYSDEGLDRFEAALAQARAGGARIVFDGNYRPRGWKGDGERARRTFARFLAHVDIALPTFDDEQALWGDATPTDTLARLARFRIGETVIKHGPDGATISADGTVTSVPVPSRVTPVDTTAAGDSFNAGYLAGRADGRDPAGAALIGHRLAAMVIGHRGAIVPREATAGLSPAPSPAPPSSRDAP